MSKLKIENGVLTEEIFQDILSELNDSILDEMEIERSIEESSGLASEPITTTVIITASSAIILSITRIIERILESKRQFKHGELVLKGFEISKEAGQALKDLSNKHSEVASSYKLIEKNE